MKNVSLPITPELNAKLKILKGLFKKNSLAETIEHMADKELQLVDKELHIINRILNEANETTAH